MRRPADIRIRTQNETLDNLKLPEIGLPSRQKRLREALLNSAYAEKDNFMSIVPKMRKTVKQTQLKILLIAASIALILFSYGIYAEFLITPLTVANITLQVNPAIRISVSEGNTVVEASGLDEQGELILSELDLRGRNVQSALEKITDVLYKSGLLESDRRILATLTAVEDKINDDALLLLAQSVRNTISSYLIEQGILLDIKVIVLNNELSEFVLTANLMPEYYIDLVDAIGCDMAAQILSLQKELDIDSALFKESLSAITSSVIEMIEARISNDNILTALRFAMSADPELRMLSTVIDALIELTEKGLGFKEAVSLIQRAIYIDPIFESSYELIDPYEGDEQYGKDEEKVDESEDKPYDYAKKYEQPESGQHENEYEQEDIQSESGQTEYDYEQEDEEHP